MAYAMLIGWLLTAMLNWTDVPEVQQLNESPRLIDIAHDAVMTSFDPAEPPLFKGELGRIKTATLLLAIASYESGFRADVDSGDVRGDSGDSWCLMQVKLPGKWKVVLKGDVYGYSTKEGWSGKDLVEDRKKCFRAALHMARESLRICKNLSVYTSGKCLRNEPAATFRMRRAMSWMNESPFSGEDELITD